MIKGKMKEEMKMNEEKYPVKKAKGKSDKYNELQLFTFIVKQKRIFTKNVNILFLILIDSYSSYPRKKYALMNQDAYNPMDDQF